MFIEILKNSFIVRRLRTWFKFFLETFGREKKKKLYSIYIVVFWDSEDYFAEKDRKKIMEFS